MSRFRMPPLGPVALTFAASFLAGCAGNSGSSGTSESNVTSPADPAPATSSSAAAPAPSTTTAEKPAASGPFWTLNGKTMAVKSALMKSYGGKMRDFYLSTGNITCENIQEHGAIMHNDKVLSIRLAPSLKSQDPPIVLVTYPTTDDRISTMKLEKHTLKMPPAAVNGMVSMPLDFDFKDSNWDSRPEQVVTFKGPIQAKDCGSFPASTDGEPAPQPKFKLEATGETIDVKGAILLPDDKEPRLIFTSDPIGCNRDSFSDVLVEVRYKGRSGLGAAFLMGNRLASAYQTSQANDLKKVDSTLPTKLPKVGSKIEIPLNGEVPLPDDHKLKFSGTITALICKP